MQFHENEGRPSDIGKHPPNHEAACQRVAHKVTITQQAPPNAKNLAQAIAPAAFGGQGLGQKKRNPQQQYHAVSRKTQEYPAPANHAQKRAADNGRDDGRHTHHQHQLGHQPDSAAFIRDVTHHSARDHHAGATAKCLHQPRGDQAFDIGRQRANQRSHRVNAKPDEQRQAPPVTIREWPVKDLPERHAQKKHRKACLRRPRRGAERLAQHRQSRQIHINRKRPNGRHRAQDEGQALLRNAHALRFRAMLRALPPPA